MSIVYNQAGFNLQFISSYYLQANRATENHIKLTKSMILKSLKDITGNILLDKVPLSAFKPVDPGTAFEDKHFEVEKVLDHDGLPSNCYYLMKWKRYLDSDNSWVSTKGFGSQ
ncbi:Chromobox protein 5 [Balamuthia mandrillaris]